MNKVLKSLSANQDNVFRNEKKLLHFGPDWITFNIASRVSQMPPSISFLDSIFKIPHNDTNASEYDSFIWCDNHTEVKIQFTGRNQMGEMIVINGQKGKSLLRITKIDKESSQTFKTVAKYSYRIDCYGTLFDYDRLGLINAQEVLSIFLSDIERTLVTHSVSRIDICADLAGYKVKSIQRGIIGSESHKKKITVFNTSEPETINYGNKTGKWMARAYNKLLDVQKKKKEWIFIKLGYFDSFLVTRLETEARSDICLENSLTLPLCFDNKYLFGIYKSLLGNKLVQFKVIPFIEKELKRNGYKIITPIKREHNSKLLSQMQYMKLCASYANGAMERFQFSFDEYIQALRPLIEPETGISSNQEALATEEDIRTILSCK